MKDLDSISFRVKRDMTIEDRDKLFEKTLEFNFPIIKKKIEPCSKDITEDMNILRDFLKLWFNFILNHTYLEDQLSSGQWHQYFLEHRFPRYFLKASIIII